MYLRNKDSGDNDSCPHSTFLGCNCYDDLTEIDDDDPANWPGVNPYGTEHYPGPSDDPAVWVTKSGSRLRLVDMTDLHLARALACCIEHDSVTHPRAGALLAELQARGSKGVK